MRKVLEFILDNFSSISFHDKDGKLIIYNSRIELEREIIALSEYIDSNNTYGTDARWVNLEADDYYAGFFMMFAYLRLGYNVLLTSKNYICETDENMINVDSDIMYRYKNEKITVSSDKDNVSMESYGEYIGLYTSGTTGSNRKYIYDSDSLISMLGNTLKELTDTEEILNIINSIDVRAAKVLNISPIYHIMGLLIPMLVLKIGLRLVTVNGMDLLKKLDIFKEEEIFAAIGVPMIWTNLEKISKRKNAGDKGGIRKLLGDDLKILICGGAKLNIKTRREYIKEGFLFLIGYGMTEVGLLSFGCQDRDDPDSEGKLFKCYDYRILDESGEIRPSGKGELLVDTFGVGSYKLTDDMEILREDLFSDRYFKTKDIVELHNNTIYSIFRKSDLVVLENGEKILLSDIEENLTELSDLVDAYRVVMLENILSLITDKVDPEKIEKISDIIRERNSEFYVFAKIKQIIMLKDMKDYTAKGEIKFCFDDLSTDEIEVIKL